MADYDPQTLQHKFDRLQELYLIQLEAQKQWVEVQNLVDELTAYYQSPQWIEDHQNNLALEYSGKTHSILSEDALWNMLTNHDELALKWMRLGLDTLDNQLRPLANSQQTPLT